MRTRAQRHVHRHLDRDCVHRVPCRQVSGVQWATAPRDVQRGLRVRPHRATPPLPYGRSGAARTRSAASVPAQEATPCPPGKVSNAVGKCETCQENFFAHKRNNTCAACPDVPAVACVGDGVARTVGPNWYCESCVGAPWIERLNRPATSSASPQRRVRHNHRRARARHDVLKSRSGALCDACADGFGAAGPTCRECPASGTVEVILLLGAVVFLGIFAQTARLSLKHSVEPESSNFVTTTSLKIMVAFIFETALLASYQLTGARLCARSSVSARPRRRATSRPSR